ncbi:hypothetical protein PYW07_009678 [Mythimna separata]|uniref:Uncharacterized protein n=1 Tax=Mythimna separata TaxID=271217 RepID=A0AAD7YBZ3_MYTSE|nr:hypothetical protein PYW07_009678 [Mythimna separata]
MSPSLLLSPWLRWDARVAARWRDAALASAASDRYLADCDAAVRHTLIDYYEVSLICRRHYFCPPGCAGTRGGRRAGGTRRWPVRRPTDTWPTATPPCATRL